MNLPWRMRFGMWFDHTRLSKAIWWVRHRIEPKNRYHVHKLRSLPPGYYDPSDQILHHAFDIFAEFMEYQLSGKSHVVWEYSKEHYPEWMLEDEEQLKSMNEEITRRNHIWSEMKDLYHWWTVVYPNQEDTLPEYDNIPKEWGTMAMFKDEYRDTPEVKAWRRNADLRNEMEDKWLQEENDNLIRLAKIRHSLWD